MSERADYDDIHNRADGVNDDEYFERDNSDPQDICSRCDGTALTLDYDTCSYCSGGAR